MLRHLSDSRILKLDVSKYDDGNDPGKADKIGVDIW